MSLDLYQPCPGGLDKKIKFCCKDLAHQLDDVSRKMQGDQLHAADEELDRLLKQYPDRQCLWALKSSLVIDTGDLDQLKEVISKFLAVAPENPIALAMSATLIATETPVREPSDEQQQATQQTNLRKAVDSLQKAVDNSQGGISVQVYEALGVVADRLMAEGHYLAAREHLTFQVLLDRENSETPFSKLLRLAGSTAVSLLLKQDLLMPPSSDGATWQSYYDASLQMAARGLWGRALERVESLLQRHPDEPVLVRAHAVLCCRLARRDEAVQSWRKYATLAGVDHDDAVEAEALAQLLDPASVATKRELVELTFDITDADAMLIKLQGSNRAVSMGIDFAALQIDDGPPPKAGFWVLDRPVPESADQVSPEDLPIRLCEVLLYGKETDRSPRLRTVLPRGTRYDQSRAALAEIAGELPVKDPEEQVLEEIPVAEAELALRPHLPKGTKPAEQQKLMREFQENVLATRWVELPLDVLLGKSPREAAAQPELVPALEAALVALESASYDGAVGLFDRIRDSLNLPQPKPLVVDSDQMWALSLVRLPRLELSKLADKDLLTCFSLAAQNNVLPAILSLGQELIDRDDMEDKPNKAEIYGRMSKATGDIDQAISFAHNAQQAAVKNGDSPAKWKVDELSLRLLRGDSAESQALLQEIQSRHIREPGIQELLVRELSRFGLVRPPGAPRPTGEKAASGAAPRAASQAPTTGPIITGSGTASKPPEPEEGKSKLWLPD